MIDLSKDSNPKHYRFVAKDGQEYVVSDIKFLPDNDKDEQPYKVFFDVDGRTDDYWIAKNGDSRGINRNLSDVGHLIKVNIERDKAEPVRGKVDLTKDMEPSHYTFIDIEGDEHEVVSLDTGGLLEHPYRVTFKVGYGTDLYWVAKNGDSIGLDGHSTPDVGYLIRKNSLRIYDFGSVKANPHDIQIVYKDLGDKVELLDVINVWNTNTMIEKFGIRWFDEVYRLSTPKVDYYGWTLYIQEGACDYPDTKLTEFEVGKTYDKEAFLKYMEVVQQAAQNLSRLRKEFGSKKKTITI